MTLAQIIAAHEAATSARRRPAATPKGAAVAAGARFVALVRDLSDCDRAHVLADLVEQLREVEPPAAV